MCIPTLDPPKSYIRPQFIYFSSHARFQVLVLPAIVSMLRVSLRPEIPSITSPPLISSRKVIDMPGSECSQSWDTISTSTGNMHSHGCQGGWGVLNSPTWPQPRQKSLLRKRKHLVGAPCSVFHNITMTLSLANKT